MVNNAPKRPTPLRGGLSEGMSPTDFNFKQLQMGIEVELEHTNDPYAAMLIAMDHLAEFRDYYTRLAAMEKAAKRYWSKRK